MYDTRFPTCRPVAPVDMDATFRWIDRYIDRQKDRKIDRYIQIFQGRLSDQMVDSLGMLLRSPLPFPEVILNKNILGQIGICMYNESRSKQGEDTLLVVMYLNRTGTRLNVKTITNQQLILNKILSLAKTVCHFLLTLFVYTLNLVPGRF